MNKFICVHGHFYQPPRENPWTGEIDAEDSAKPFHDWNERINEECYRANTRAAILNPKGQVIERVNNFSRISFDMGPTLLSWIRRKDPETYKAILEADRESRRRHGGHGNAVAQCYNHMIMPLAGDRDKVTQVVWGIRDFEFHFKRKPEGMWLPETAVDLESLAVLARHGIRYTILAPHQSKRFRRVGFSSYWESVRDEHINARRPYRVLLPRGGMIHVFFYDAPISRAIAFEGLLFNGDHMAHRLQSAFGQREKIQLVSTATDGESFGHHHKLGEMAIAYGLRKIEKGKFARLTNYGEYLDRYGSQWEAEIKERSSWSCAHGVERWRADCGCRLNFNPKWNQRWRAVMRDAFDYLRGIVDAVFDVDGAELLKDPWAARNDYIDVLLDGSPKRRQEFLRRHAKRGADAEAAQKIFQLLEAQRFAMYMYTSCGWFFDDVSGLEAVQVMKFAQRAIELTQPFFHQDIESAFLQILRGAKSNFPEYGTGAEVFKRFAKGSRPGAHAVPAHAGD